MRFEDAEYDETGFQREMQRISAATTPRSWSRDAEIADVFPDVIEHTERPILRTAPAPMFLLSRLVRAAGIKVVLTGEGADEMFAGYDIFREAKVRRFWAREPELGKPAASARTALSVPGAVAGRPAGHGAQVLRARSSNARICQASRTSRAGRARRRSSACSPSASSNSPRAFHVVDELLARCRATFAGWTPLAQDQYLEVRTLLPGYILSSQGDRMLMANSVEGRFPFLDADVMRLAASLPDSYKLKVLDEKHVLKRVSRGLVPPSILARKKQPYRAPDAACFVAVDGPAWVGDVTSADSVTAAGVFSPKAVEQLFQKCRGRQDAQFSNADNMAVVGVLSTQLLYRQFIQSHRPTRPITAFTTRVDRLVRGNP